MKRIYCAFFACWLAFAVPLAAAVTGKEASYVGGTVAAIRENQQGTLDTSGGSGLVFRWGTGEWEVPFAKITKMVYREKVGRQVGATVATTVAIGPSGLFLLAAKKKKHYLSLNLKDETGEARVVVFELSKDRFEEVIADLEEKTGLPLEVEVTTPAQKK